MTKQILAIALALFLLVFGTNRINQSKATITSNYLVLNSVERQNLEELLEVTKFYIPSFSFDTDSLGLKPYENSNGKMEVFVGDAIYEGIISPELDGKDCFNNNYLYRYTISYNNTTKELNIEDKTSQNGTVQTVTVTRSGEQLQLLQLQ